VGGKPVRPGVLALQGDFAEHCRALQACGTDPVEVRTIGDLERIDALIVPGGESTTMLKLIDRYELREPLVKHIEAGMPVFGTCAGAIVLASRASDGEPPLGVLDVTVRRNAFGRQRESFETEVDVAGVGRVSAVFIRAPVFEDPGEEVEVLATWADRPVAVRAGALLAIAFHPELTGTLGMHRFFLEEIA
jgi:5'-phosphate synthase pdxT subunit